MTKFILVGILVTQLNLITRSSYYSDKLNGRKTASGQVFDNSKLTAAHRTLKFGTKVRVTNIKNCKSVIVGINDRGPHIKSVGIDISKEAFSRIADLREGVISVRLCIQSEK